MMKYPNLHLHHNALAVAGKERLIPPVVKKRLAEFLIL